MRRVDSGRQLKVALKVTSKMAKKDFSAYMRELGLYGHRELITLTPKDTGWASQHWSLGLNYTHETEDSAVDPLNSVTFGDYIAIYSNVPYIKRLDEGWSMQRPSGFLHIAQMRVTNKAKKLGKDLSVEVYNV